ncbi:choice-of-anchor Q domain-containing protein, partial [Streptomyces sp. NPDC056295]|uniref:choice-of-anchor Q domain-containing protein n=1 Tax=Streptomyces sp. NPDC056295 TaxID=3345774 RepID=UPI0035DCA7E5
RSGRPGAPITFTAYPGHRPVLNPKTAWNGISVYGASHVVIKNLEVKGNNAALSLADAERSSSKTDPTYNTNCISVEKNRESGTFPHHVDIVHNTAYLNGRSTRIKTPYANIFAHDSTDVRLLNNIAYGRPGQATNSKSHNVNVTYDYNVYFGGRAPETKGPHDIIADPKFTAPGKNPNADFRLTKGSPAIGSGTPFPAMTTDFTGAIRKGGAPDRGAYSFGASTSGGDSSVPEQESPNAGAGEPSGETNAGPSAGTDAVEGAGTETGADAAGGKDAKTGATGDDGSGLTAHGESEPLAQTGGTDPVLLLGIAASVLVTGAGLLVLARRRRS